MQPLRKPQHHSMCADSLQPKPLAACGLATGYREHLPRFRCLSAKSEVQIVVLACLTSTIRSQSFSLSQRFDPRTSSRPCFIPHPLIGFLAFRAFPTEASRGVFRHSLLSCHYTSPLTHALRLTASCLAVRGPKAGRLTSEPCSDSMSVHSVPRVNDARSRCSPDLSPLRGLPVCWPVFERPPLLHLAFMVPDENRQTPFGACASGYPTNQTWDHLQKEGDPASMRFTTLHKRSPSLLVKSRKTKKQSD
jgi:hypothetical protein